MKTTKALTPGDAIVIDQVDKVFTTKLVVGTKGSNIDFKNSDTIDHNIYANDLNAKVDFDIGLVEPGGSSILPMDWDSGKIVRIGCKIHPRMRSYIANLSTKYHLILPFEKGKASYEFELDNVPDELTRIKVWMPRYNPIELDISVGESKEVELTKKEKVYGTLKLTR